MRVQSSPVINHTQSPTLTAAAPSASSQGSQIPSLRAAFFGLFVVAWVVGVAAGGVGAAGATVGAVGAVGAAAALGVVAGAWVPVRAAAWADADVATTVTSASTSADAVGATTSVAGHSPQIHTQSWGRATHSQRCRYPLLRLGRLAPAAPRRCWGLETRSRCGADLAMGWSGFRSGRRRGS